MIFRRNKPPERRTPPAPPASPRPSASPQPPASPHFYVRPLSPPQPATPAIVAATSTLEATAVRYAHDAAAFNFIAALVGSPFMLQCHRDVRDSSVWVVVDLREQVICELAVATGGRLCLSGIPAELLGWPVVTLAELASAFPVPNVAADQSEVIVLTTGRLANPLVQQWMDEGVPVTFFAVVLRSVRQPDVTLAAVGLRLRSSHRLLPARKLLAMAALPDTMVLRHSQPRLLLDFQAQLPMSEEVLAATVPADERWVVSAAGFGAWRIEVQGVEVEPTLTLPGGLTALPPAGAPGPPPATLRVDIRLVPRRGGADRIAAVLVGDDELEALRTFLSHAPGGDELVILLGPGQHLLTEPSGLTQTVPFGVPLTRHGRHGVYLQAGHVLRPRPPEDALASYFGLERGSVVTVTQIGVCRFSIEHLVPAWSLWLGPAPEVRSELSSRGLSILHGLSDTVGQPVAATTTPDLSLAKGIGALAEDPTKRRELVLHAVKLEQAGEFSQAARTLELAGDFSRAGRLYELAAQRYRGGT